MVPELQDPRDWWVIGIAALLLIGFAWLTTRPPSSIGSDTSDVESPDTEPVPDTHARQREEEGLS
ncbi:hypothetical protein GCM10010329_78320 [Streptomyces spiroverticillatus]|uniref:Uncharacterized protein n=1 Tax=Streptomyces finlayi TaxID=67296 RepID=A0A918X5U8_9ACTN|nr:hypothetical protein [Streptomyces finlayi]GHA43736.1 hypothetical protein GCM10010329_78320 [Streptomyces spiroverticillatus]GHD13199.1 hypothetical protein GCM10010334_71030 [Streptomyces finlayi]